MGTRNGSHKGLKCQVPSSYTVAPGTLRPTICLSKHGRGTSRMFGSTAQAPRPVHTSLVSMLLANELTEDMLHQMLGTTVGLSNLVATTSPALMGIVHRTKADSDTASRAGSPAQGQQGQAAGEGESSSDYPVKLIGLDGVRAAALPPYLKRKYQADPAGGLHRPDRIQSCIALPKAVPRTGPREQDGPQGVAGRTAGQGALVEEALLLAQGALQRERAAAQLAHDAASSVPAFVRPRAKSAAHHFGSSAFRAPDREHASKVGYMVASAPQSVGPAHYRPQWQYQKPSVGSLSLRTVYSAGGRHYEAIQSQQAVLKEAAQQLSAEERAAAALRIARPHTAPTRTRKASSIIPEVSNRRVQGTILHVKPATFARAQASNSAPFKASTHDKIAGYAVLSRRIPSTPASIGPGTYDPDQATVRPRSATPNTPMHLQTPRPAPTYPTSAPPGIGPGSYAPRHPTGASHKNWPSSGSAPKASAVLDPEPRAADFSRGSVRPGSAPPMGLRSRGYVDAAVLRAERVVYMEAHNEEEAAFASRPASARSISHSASPVLRVPSAPSPTKHSSPRSGVVAMVPAAGDDLDAQAFVYDDDSDDGGSEVGDLEQCWTKHASPVPAGHRPVTHGRPPSGRVPSAGRPHSCSSRATTAQSCRPESSVSTRSTRPVSASQMLTSLAAREADSGGGSHHPVYHTPAPMVAERVSVHDSTRQQLGRTRSSGLQGRVAHGKQAGSFFSNEHMARTLRFNLAPPSMVHRPELHAGIAPSSKPASRHWITNRPHSAAVKHLQLGPGDYSEASPFCGTPFKAVHCGTMARCTRTQELRGQRLMGEGKIVKPVTAVVAGAVDVSYDVNISALSHRRRTPGTHMPPNRTVSAGARQWMTGGALGRSVAA